MPSLPAAGRARNRKTRKLVNLTPVHAEFSGSDTCTAAGITVTANAPALALCRQLLAAGLDPDRALEVFRNGTLALRIRSIGEGARLTVKEPDRGRPHFAKWKAWPPSPAAPPIAPMAEAAE
jgi:hypothetical protein